MNYRQRPNASKNKNKRRDDIEAGYDDRLDGKATGSISGVRSGRRPFRFVNPKTSLFVGVGLSCLLIGKYLRTTVTTERIADAYDNDSSIDRQNEKVGSPEPDPPGWETWDRHELKEYLECGKLFETSRPIISDEEWRYFRDLYNQHVAEQGPDNKDVTYKMGKKPFDSPVVGAFTPDKGRGLIASRDIARGETIFTASNNTIVFTTGHSWRKFVWHLGHAVPPDDRYRDGFACDIYAWSWNQRVPADGPVQVVVDIDASSLLNQPSEGEYANIQCGRDEDEECGMDYYATEDIKKGDEILCHYSDFSKPKWHSLGL